MFMLAEREGFEPPVHLRILRISSAVRSTTLPPLRGRRHVLKTRRRVGGPLSMGDHRRQGGSRFAGARRRGGQRGLSGGFDSFPGDMRHKRHGLANLPG
jgi:hypothetical protein